jgi:hypothetical protein
MAQQRARGLETETDPTEEPATFPRLDRDAQARLGEQLRAMYDELLQQPVPNRFVELLKSLDEVEKEKMDDH